jgi:putative transposase
MTPDVLFPVRALSVWCSGGNTSRRSNRPSRQDNSTSGRPSRSPSLRPSRRSSRSSGPRTGSSTPSPPSLVPSRCSPIRRYTHRIAIGNERLLDSENGSVRFRYRDYAHGNKVKVMRLAVVLSIPPPCALQGLHADPALWPPRQSPSYRASGRLSGRLRCAYSSACRTTVEAFLSRVLRTDVNPTVVKDGCVRFRAFPPLPRATGPPFLRWAA